MVFRALASQAITTASEQPFNTIAAGAAVVSPVWLPFLAGWAGFLLSVMGTIWFFVQSLNLVLKMIERRKNGGDK